MLLSCYRGVNDIYAGLLNTHPGSPKVFGAFKCVPVLNGTFVLGSEVWNLQCPAVS